MANDTSRRKRQLGKSDRRVSRRHLRQAPAAPVTSVTNTGPGATATSGGTAVGQDAIYVGGSVYGDITTGGAPPPIPPGELREAYLAWIVEQVHGVQLSGIDRKSISEQTRRDLDLAAVYTALMTLRSDERPEGRDGKRAELTMPDRDARRLSALAVLDREPRLALLGDPGSGKSTFVNFVALCMAGQMLGRDDANLATLCAPLPADGEDRRRQPEKDNKPQPQPWRHGALLPVRVVLREFVARGLPRAGENAPVNGDWLWRFIIAELPETLRDFAKTLRDELLGRGGLLLLDGLDEVPEADERRAQVKAAVEGFAAAFPRVRALVTSRTYAYQKQDWKLDHFSEAVLAPFGGAQIRNFVVRWYAYMGQARGLADTEVQGRAALLNDAIERNPRLFELAQRPLLLTLMASLHAWRGGTLPDQREELYAEAVDLLLDQWENQKVKRRADGTYQVIQPSLAEWLSVDQKAVRQLLNRLAFEAHRDQRDLLGTADIAQDKLVGALLYLNLSADARPARLIEHLRDRAGLLEPRGVGVYAFPHRTFQEYLAACHLTDFGFPDDLADLLRAEPNRWREVVLLAGAKASRGTASAAWSLADALCYQAPPDTRQSDEVGYWGALLAAQVLIQNGDLAYVSERNKPKLERVRNWLVCTLQHGALTPIDRVLAGRSLAVLGDPRPGVGLRADGLPDIDWVLIPDDGEFVYGEGNSQRTLQLPAYKISRYPITYAQFQTFVNAPDGFHNLHWWQGLPDGAQHRSAHEFQAFRFANHPCERVSCYDAVAFCRWLHTKLGARISLPNEYQWEKAARGLDGRIYPWGNAYIAGFANIDETEIKVGSNALQTTSAVGMYPQGQSPYGLLDMSGNVWEWCINEFVISASNEIDGSVEVPLIRGSSFAGNKWDARCSFSGRMLSPGNRFSNLGFRIVERLGPSHESKYFGSLSNGR
jgi:formylglycine-generating enzyme required for sulfatase activity